MFKFVVLCAFVATAVAEPEPGALLWSSPLVQPYAAYSTVVSPASTSISSQSSSVVHPSPITYTTPLAFSHFIKKRSAQLLAPAYSTPYSYFPYNYPSPAVVSASPVVQTPIAYTGVQLPLATHLIKKRSAQLLSTPFIAPTPYFANPAISAPLLSSPYYQTPYFAGAQLPLLNTHSIKKRSAEPSAEPSAQFLATSYYAPSSSYIKTVPTTTFLSSPTLIPKYYTTPGLFPLATTHLIKKRSAEPSAEPSADPMLINPVYPSTYFGGSPFIPTYPTYPAATLYNAAPVLSSNPFVYSSFIKK